MVSCMGCLLLCMFIISALFKGTTANATYTLGWGFPPSKIMGPLSVGDTLVFNVTSGHSVGEFSKANYDSCSNKFASINFVGPAMVRYSFNAIGEHYYFCSLGNYCEQNMKLATNDVAPPTPTPSSAPLFTCGVLYLLLLCTVIAFLY